jgi:hypothetical protein
MNADGHQSESNKTTAGVATALWAVFPSVKSSAEVDRPQVRTSDGFVLRRTGGYNICEIVLIRWAQCCVDSWLEIHLWSGREAPAAGAADAVLPQEVITATELRRAPHPPAPDHVLPDLHSSRYRR